MTVPRWTYNPALATWTRDDGATVVREPSRKRPWRGSYWHDGKWKPFIGASRNVATAERAMNNVDWHWPKWMERRK